MKDSLDLALRFILNAFILALALFVAFLVLPGLRIGGNAIIALGFIAVLVGLVNALIGPFVAQLSFGPLVRTASVFTLVINALVLWLSTGIARWLFNLEVFFDTFGWAFLGAVIVSVVSEVLATLVPPDRLAQALMTPNTWKVSADPRTIVRRIFGLIAMALSLALFIANLAGIVGVWAARGPLTENVVTWLGRAEPVLEVADNAFVRVNSELARARVFVNRVETDVTELGEDVINNRRILTVISNTVGGQLGQTIFRVGETINAVGEVVVAVNTTVEAVNALPFVSVPPLPQEVVAVAEGVTQIRNEVKALEDRINTFKANVVSSVVTEVTDRTTRIDGLLSQVETRTTLIEQRIKFARQAVAVAKAEAPRWILLGAIGVTLFLLWFALSQAVMFFYAWSLADLKPLFPNVPVRFSPRGG